MDSYWPREYKRGGFVCINGTNIKESLTAAKMTWQTVFGFFLWHLLLTPGACEIMFLIFMSFFFPH